MSKATADLRFIVTVGDGSGLSSPYLTFRAGIVYVGEDGHFRNPLWDSYGEGRELGALGDLAVTAQRDTTSAEWYGFDVSYCEPHRVKLDHAEAMVKTLRKVSRSLDRQQATYGYADTLVSYVTRVAQ